MQEHQMISCNRLAGVSLGCVQRIAREAPIEHFNDTTERRKRRIGRPNIVDGFRKIIGDILAKGRVSTLPRSASIGVNVYTLLFALMITVLTGSLLALASSAASSKLDVITRLKTARQGAGNVVGPRFHLLLVSGSCVEQPWASRRRRKVLLHVRRQAVRSSRCGIEHQRRGDPRISMQQLLQGGVRAMARHAIGYGALTASYYQWRSTRETDSPFSHRFPEPKGSS